MTTGLLDPIFLRRELGVLPAELVIHRNALYYLWHLRRRAWFRDYLNMFDLSLVYKKPTSTA